MGVDWVPARPRRGVDVSHLRLLIEAQVYAVRRYGIVDDGLSAPNAVLEHAEPAGDVHKGLSLTPGEIGQQLEALLEIVTRDGVWPSFRVAVVGHNRLYPPQWRYRAYSTFLPADASRALARWQQWYEKIRTGRMHHYVGRLIADDCLRQLHETQASLLQLMNQAMSKSNAWTRAERFRHACAQVQALPNPPAVMPVGPPPVTDTDDVPTADQDQAVRALNEHITLINAAIRAFNRTVPAAFKAPYAQQLPSEVPTRDPWLEEFFTWATPAIETGYGLYLWT